MLHSLLSMLLNSNQDYIEYLIFVGFYWVKWDLIETLLQTSKSNMSKYTYSIKLVWSDLSLTGTSQEVREKER